MRIYKYCPVDEYSKENLRNAKLWFNNPEKFIDEMDVNLPTAEINTEVFYKDSLQFFEDNPELFIKYKKIFEESGIEKGNLPISISDMMTLMKQTYLGITCFTDSDINDYMWKEYGDNDKGFCLCFETENDEAFFKDLTKVRYVDKLPEINLLSENLEKEMEFLITTKVTQYQQENEYRLLKHNLGLHAYKRECLVGISFGKFITSREELLKIIAENYGNHRALEKL